MQAYFDGEDVSKVESATQWDEGAWSAGKDGDVGMAGGVGNDHLLAPLASSAAATRPNSPAPSTRSNLRPQTQQEEEDDLRKAMAMSRGEEVGTAFQMQETGVVQGGAAVFGPANRENYDNGQWAMVPYGGAVAGTSEEIIPDTLVEERAGGAGEPRMLKPLPGGDYTAGLLTICACIEGAREALLMRGHVLDNYGQDAEWWRGHPISLPKIVHVDDGRPAEPESDKREKILAEVQRVMAVLSSSKRSYASAQALTQTSAIKEGTPASTRSRTLLEMFLQEWAVAAASKAEDPEEVTRLFSTTVGTNDADGMETPDMSLIDMQVALPEGAKMDLFELLDSLLWNTDADGLTMADNYIERPAEVLVMRVYQASPVMGPQLRIEVPAQFYVDKYLKENIEATRATRSEMAKGKQRIAKIEEIEKKLNFWKHPTKNDLLDAGKLLNHTLCHFSGQNRLEVVKADKTNNVAIPEEMPADPPHYAAVAAELEKIIASINTKLGILAEEKEKTRKAISEMSKAPPPGLNPEDLKHRYTLRGVATKPGITYVTVPKNANTADEMFDDDSTPSDFRWWRLEYDSHASAAVAKLTKTKAADYDVLRAVELEHNSALLVYASDRVNAAPIEPFELPPPLQAFVDADDQYLEADIYDAAISTLPTYNMSLTDDDLPRESIESRERTSMDSTRVEGADGSRDGGSRAGSTYGDPSPPGYEDHGFMDHHGFGLGPELGIKQGYAAGFEGMQMEEDVHEIRLEEGEGGEEEMVERAHEPLIPGLGRADGEEAERVDW